MNLQIFVLHATNLTIRLPLINQLVDKLRESKRFDNINMELITQYDPKDLDLPTIRQFVSLTKQSGSDFYNDLIKNMHVKQVSNAMKHLLALRKVSDAVAHDSIAANKTTYLVLEDDIVYGDDISKKLPDTIALLKTVTESWDIVMLGTPAVHTVVDGSPMEITEVKKMFRIMPCCDSYIINPNSASKLVSKFIPIRLCSNIQFSYINEQHPDVNIMMTIPNIFVDGSKLGIYISNVTPNNKLFLNKEYNKLYNLLNRDTSGACAGACAGQLTAEELAEVEKGLKEIRFANHPDIMYLNALYHMKLGKPKEAENIFTQAYQIYQQNDAVINNESEFLLNYMRVYRDLPLPVPATV